MDGWRDTLLLASEQGCMKRTYTQIAAKTSTPQLWKDKSEDESPAGVDAAGRRKKPQWRCLWVAALTKPALPMLGFLLCKIISIFMFQAFLARYLLLECQSNILHHFLHGHLNSFLWTRQFLNYISNSLLLLIREAADLFVGLLSSLVITLTSSKSLSIKSLTDDYRTCK